MASPAEPKIVGRYALFGELAAGGMATVHFGRLLGPVGFSKTVAIKRLHAQYAKDPEFAAMFLDEARLAARVQHPNVVSTLDVVALDGELFLVLEYVHGETLSRLQKGLRKAGQRIPVKVAATIVSNALHGLHAAHEATDEHGAPLHIVHRDVSPQNVMIGSDGVARVLDFGVAKAVGRLQSTREGQIKGKLSYMAPEQVTGEAVDRRTDVYAAAIVLWEALAGQRLFDADNEAALCMQIAAGAKRAPGQVVDGVPASLDAIVMRGLARAPDDRFATAREMAVEIEEAVGLASPRQVGEWLVSIAGDALAGRAERVKEIESGGSVDRERATAPPPEDAHDVAPPPSVSPKSETGLTATEGSAKIERPRAMRAPWAIFGAIALVVGVAAALVIRAGATGAASGAPRPADAPPATSATATPPTAEEAPRAVASSKSASSSATTEVTAVPARAAPSGRLVRPPVTAKPAAPDCDPPFTVDATGVRKIKPQCL